jgi:hypothetical protein
METISTAIRSIVQDKPDGDPEVLARSLLKKYPGASLVSLIVREISLVQRSMVRDTEKSAFSSLFNGGGGADVPDVDMSIFKRLFEKCFSLGDGTVVSWGDATLAQHQMRITMLVKQRQGLDDTIERHRRAVEIIVAAGVSRLNEVSDVAKAAA